MTEFRYRFYRWIAGFIDIAVGVCSVFTFSYYRPSWDFDYIAWVSIKELKK